MCSKMRRLVHLIADDMKAGYTIRNIDVRPLFSDCSVGVRSQAARLPRPLACMETFGKTSRLEFFLLGSKIVSVNQDRHTTLCDTETSAFRIGPDLLHSKSFDPAWAAMGGRLYLINMFPDNYGTACFEALHFDNRIQDWLWDLLPSPPFLDMPFESGCDIQSYGAGDDKNIWISTEEKGTYTFDITTGAWCKVGEWALPFEGRVQYIPEYNLCVGFCNQSRNLCSAELTVEPGSKEPPAHRKVLDDDVDGSMVSGWQLVRSHLTYLGCGKFCVTRFFDTTCDLYEPRHHVAVMTAMEATASGTGELQMINKASRRYKFSLGTRFGWAL